MRLRYALLIALLALVAMPLSAQQRRFTTIISQPEPLPNCAPGAAGIQMPIVWDITAAEFEFCSSTNTWSILSGGGGGGSGPIIQTNGASNTVQTTLNFQNVNVFSWTNPSSGNEQLNFSSQSANCFIAAPNGVGGIPSCRLTVAADLPAGTTCATHFYATGLLAGLIPVCVQPSFTDLLGTISLAQTALTTNGDLLSVSGGALARVPSAGGQDFVLQGANAAVPVWLAVNNCGSGTQALSYSTSTHTFGCQTITTGTGTINNSTQYSAAYYSAAGNTNTISGIAAPTTPSIAYILTSTPSGGVATAPTWSIPGIPINAQTGTSYTIANTDRENLVTDSNTGATAITLPQAGSTGFASNFNFALANINTGLVTITPTTSTINGNATQIVPNHWISYIYSDNTNYRSGTLPDIAAFPNCVTTALQFTSATGVFSCPASFANSALTNSSTTVDGATCTLGSTCTPNVPLNQVISPTGAIATLADGNNPLTLNCAQTSNTQACVTVGEITAATGTSDVGLQLSTLTTSTAIPLQITQGANGPANSNAPALISITAAAAGGLASASNSGSTGALINLVTGAGSAGGATTGNGGSGGNFVISTGVGGVAGGTATNNGGSGGAFSFTTGAGGNGGSGAGTAGNGGNFTVSLGTPGTNSATGTAGVVGQFAVQGTAPASTANASGVASGTTFVVSGVAGGATSNAAGTGGVGSISTINSGTGGAGTGTNAVGGAGGNINLTAANGGASNGSGVNSNGGNIAMTVGSAGTGGSGTAGKAGVVSVTGPTAGLVYYTQGSAPTTANTQIPANSRFEYVPTSVTAMALQKSGTAPVNNNSAELCSNASPGICAFAKMSQTGMAAAQQAGLTSVTNLTGLSFSVEANTKYVMNCTLYYQVSATTANLSIAITGPASPTFVTYSLFDTDTATGVAESGVATSFATTLSGSGTSTATTNFPATVTMGLSNGVNAGTVQVQAGAVGTGNSTIQTGSWCQLQ